MATLTYMPAEHVPVLAPELIALVDPGPGELVVDCTFGGGGHARLAADRIGPTGTLVAIDRDPAAAERFAELEPELGCEARFERGDFADVLERLAAEGTASRRRVHGPRDLLAPARQLGARASRTPTTRRSTCGWTRASR